MMDRAKILASLFVREALRAQLRHKLRSAMTMLGITMGIASVLLIVAVS